MNIRKGTALPPPSKKRIREFNEDNEIRLPKDFVDFLDHGHGGVPIRNILRTQDNEKVVEFFLCLFDDASVEEEDGWRDIEVILTEIGARIGDDEDLIGNNIIPIASLFAGDFVCLDFRENSKKPTVVVWNHEESDDFAPVVEKVADSFTEFLAKLTK